MVFLHQTPYDNVTTGTPTFKPKILLCLALRAKPFSAEMTQYFKFFTNYWKDRNAAGVTVQNLKEIFDTESDLYVMK